MFIYFIIYKIYILKYLIYFFSKIYNNFRFTNLSWLNLQLYWNYLTPLIFINVILLTIIKFSMTMMALALFWRMTVMCPLPGRMEPWWLFRSQPPEESIALDTRVGFRIGRGIDSDADQLRWPELWRRRCVSGDLPAPYAFISTWCGPSPGPIPTLPHLSPRRCPLPLLLRRRILGRRICLTVWQQ